MMNLKQNLEKSGRGLIEVLSQHEPGGTEETTKCLRIFGVPRLDQDLYYYTFITGLFI
jgi:hypothetical protein